MRLWYQDATLSKQVPAEAEKLQTMAVGLNCCRSHHEDVHRCEQIGNQQQSHRTIHRCIKHTCSTGSSKQNIVHVRETLHAAVPLQDSAVQHRIVHAVKTQ